MTAALSRPLSARPPGWWSWYRPDAVRPGAAILAARSGRAAGQVVMTGPGLPGWLS
jgi:hypothetical protein